MCRLTNQLVTSRAGFLRRHELTGGMEQTAQDTSRLTWGFLKYANTLDNSVSLRLFHKVFSFDARATIF